MNQVPHEFKRSGLSDSRSFQQTQMSQQHNTEALDAVDGLPASAQTLQLRPGDILHNVRGDPRLGHDRLYETDRLLQLRQATNLNAPRLAHIDEGDMDGYPPSQELRHLMASSGQVASLSKTSLDHRKSFETREINYRIVRAPDKFYEVIPENSHEASAMSTAGGGLAVNHAPGSGGKRLGTYGEISDTETGSKKPALRNSGISKSSHPLGERFGASITYQPEDLLSDSGQVNRQRPDTGAVAAKERAISSDMPDVYSDEMLSKKMLLNCHSMTGSHGELAYLAARQEASPPPNDGELTAVPKTTLVTSKGGSRKSVLLDHKKISGSDSHYTNNKPATEHRDYGSSSRTKEYSHIQQSEKGALNVPSGQVSGDESNRLLYNGPATLNRGITVCSSSRTQNAGRVHHTNSKMRQVLSENSKMHIDEPGADGSISGDLTQNGKSEPICSGDDTARPQTENTGRNQHFDERHTRQPTSTFPGKVENTKSHDAIYSAAEVNDLCYTYNGSFSVNETKDRSQRRPEAKGLENLARIRLARSNEPIPIKEARSTSEAHSGMFQPPLTTSSLSALRGIGNSQQSLSANQRFLHAPSTLQSRQNEKHSESIMNQIKDQRARSSDADVSSRMSHSVQRQRLFDNLASVQNIHAPAEAVTRPWKMSGKVPHSIQEVDEKARLHSLLDASGQQISEGRHLEQDVHALKAMSQPISDGGPLQFQPGLTNEYQETYGSQPHPKQAPRNFFMQSGLTFNGNNLSGLANSNHSQHSGPEENEIEIWEGEQQLDGRQLQELTHGGVYPRDLDGHQTHESAQVYLHGRPLVVEPVIERRVYSKPASGLRSHQASNRHTRTNSKVIKRERSKASQAENSTSQAQTQSHSTSNQILPEHQRSLQNESMADRVHVMHSEGNHEFADGGLEEEPLDQQDDYASESDEVPYESRQARRKSQEPNARSADSLLRPKSQLSAESVEFVQQALEPQTVFDLPDALVQIGKLNSQVEQLEAELSLAQSKSAARVSEQEKVNSLETQVLDLVEEKRQLRMLLDKARLELFDNKENQSSNIEGQKVFSDLVDQVQRLEDEKQQLLESQQALQAQVGHLQSLLDEGGQLIAARVDEERLAVTKQREIDSLLAERQERDSWLKSQYDHIAMLTSQVERAWQLIASHVPGSHPLTQHVAQMVSAEPSQDLASQPDLQETERHAPVADSERAASIGQITTPPEQAQSQAVSDEIQKLRLLFTRLIEFHPSTNVHNSADHTQDKTVHNSRMNSDLQQHLSHQQVSQQIEKDREAANERIAHLEEEKGQLERQNKKLKSKFSMVKAQLDGVEQKLEKFRPGMEQEAARNDSNLLHAFGEIKEQNTQLQVALNSVLGQLLNNQQLPFIVKDTEEAALSGEVASALSQFTANLQKLGQASQLASVQAQEALEREQKMARALSNERRLKRGLLDKIQDYYGTVRVFCRIRPMLRHERKKQKPLEYEVQGNRLTIPSASRRVYNFDAVLDSAGQTDVFDELQGAIASALNGHNVCVMSYGQTGSGKTYTMVGDDANPGLYFNATDEVFRLIRKDPAHSYELHCSVVEIYNEQIRDLLSKDQKNNGVKLVEKDGLTYAQQTRRLVKTKNSVLKCLRDSFYHRTVGVTEVNEASSRSHFIVSIQIKQKSSSGTTRFGQLTLVDLAGSERVVKSGVSRSRIHETASINSSLATLGKVFMHMKNGSAHKPYRDSKLTHYLRDCIGGDDCKTVMILQVSPLAVDQAESISTLGFGADAQEIRRRSASRATAKKRGRQRSQGTGSKRGSLGRRSLPPRQRSGSSSLCRGSIGRKDSTQRKMVRTRPVQIKQSMASAKSTLRKAQSCRKLRPVNGKHSTKKKGTRSKGAVDISPSVLSRSTRRVGLRASDKGGSPLSRSHLLEPTANITPTLGGERVRIDMNNRIFEAQNDSDTEPTTLFTSQNEHLKSQAQPVVQQLEPSAPTRSKPFARQLPGRVPTSQLSLLQSQERRGDATTATAVDSSMAPSEPREHRTYLAQGSGYRSALDSTFPDAAAHFDRPRATHDLPTTQGLQLVEREVHSSSMKKRQGRIVQQAFAAAGQAANSLQQSRYKGNQRLLDELREVNQKLQDIDKRIHDQEKQIETFQH